MGKIAVGMFVGWVLSLALTVAVTVGFHPGPDVAFVLGMLLGGVCTVGGAAVEAIYG